jgi:hypothetical protein
MAHSLLVGLVPTKTAATSGANMDYYFYQHSDLDSVLTAARYFFNAGGRIKIDVSKTVPLAPQAILNGMTWPIPCAAIFGSLGWPTVTYHCRHCVHRNNQSWWKWHAQHIDHNHWLVCPCGWCSRHYCVQTVCRHSTLHSQFYTTQHC